MRVDPELAREVRNEIYTAKTLVRVTRNHTKVTAAALADCEERLDALIALIEVPTPEEAQEHATQDHTRTAQAQAR